MTKYVICERSLHHAHAGSKARDDIRQLLEQDAWKPFEVHPGENKGYVDKLLCVGYTIADWKRLERTVQPADVVLIQFPLIMYNKVSLYALPSVRRMKEQGVRFIMLVHDLESLRGYSFTGFDKQWVAEADALISHNPRMSEVLREYGAKAPIKEIGIFDYLLPDMTPVPPERRHGIDIAGNLSHDKAGYLYRLAEQFPDADINLYGPKFDSERGPSEWYRGICTPDELPNKLQGRFGLIWDGDSAETCTGFYGKYLTVNNPHKLSLYLASGKPVIIWKEAALASFVTEHGVGIAVNTLREAIQAEHDIDEEEYLTMARRAEVLGARLREGHYAKKVMEEMQSIMPELQERE